MLRVHRKRTRRPIDQPTLKYYWSRPIASEILPVITSERQPTASSNVETPVFNDSIENVSNVPNGKCSLGVELALQSFSSLPDTAIPEHPTSVLLNRSLVIKTSTENDSQQPSTSSKTHAKRPLVEISNTREVDDSVAIDTEQNWIDDLSWKDIEINESHASNNKDFACRTFGGSVYAIVDIDELRRAHQTTNKNEKRNKIYSAVKNIGTCGGVRWKYFFPESSSNRCIFGETVFWEYIYHRQKHLFDTSNFADVAGSLNVKRYAGVGRAFNYTQEDVECALKRLFQVLTEPVIIEPKSRWPCKICDQSFLLRCFWALHCQDEHGIKGIEEYLLDTASYSRSRENWRNYQAENREKCSERSRNYRAENREKCSERSRNYRAENREKCSERSRNYRAENREKVNEISRNYYAANREKMREKARQSYAKKKKAAIERLDEGLRRGEENYEEKLKKERQQAHDEMAEMKLTILPLASCSC
ncbi:hypothetical protein M3Y98_00015600 [Aphelenchoides besseyi]|nr:hypothetical protein M3Y98_00015600 [Aphelenchoides besseyi]